MGLRAAGSAGPTPFRRRGRRGSATRTPRRDRATPLPDWGYRNWQGLFVRPVETAPCLAPQTGAARTNRQGIHRRRARCPARTNHSGRHLRYQVRTNHRSPRKAACSAEVWDRRRCAAVRGCAATPKDQMASETPVCVGREMKRAPPAGSLYLFGRSRNECASPPTDRRFQNDPRASAVRMVGYALLGTPACVTRGLRRRPKLRMRLKTKKPGAVSRPGTLREFQFHE
jgi:hypothetical protein